MSTLLINKESVFAVKVWFENHKLCVQLHDGRELAVPLDWFPKLRDATDAQRLDFRLIGRGIGIHWQELDEDISIARLLH